MKSKNFQVFKLHIKQQYNRKKILNKNKTLYSCYVQESLLENIHKLF